MGDPMNEDKGGLWTHLVEDAMTDSERVSAIFEALDPILRKLVRKVSSRLSDDLMQAARIAIWKAIPKVDLNRGRSIRAMLLKTAYHAMRDEVRKEVRRARVPLEHFYGKPTSHLDRRQQRFGGILDRYADYVRRNGAFAGAHRHMAKVLDVSIAKTTSDFHRAAREYVEREGLRPPKKQYANTIEMILRMTDTSRDPTTSPYP